MHTTDALMDAAHLILRVAQTHNQGDLYGDTVSLEAQRIHNQGGVIAVRNRLEMGPGTLKNEAQGWIACADRLTLGAPWMQGCAGGQAHRVQN
jgi:hypothetical protein